MTHYPIYLNITDRSCLVVGGGKVAQRKIETLMEYGARITVVSPEVESAISQWAREEKLNWVKGSFDPALLQGVLLVFIATNQAETNREIADICRSEGVLVNAVDDPPNCDFFIPSLLRRDSLSVAISTEGKSPMFAAWLRRELEELIPPEYGEFVEIMGKLRDRVKDEEQDINKRRKIFEALIKSDILELLLEGNRDEVEERIEQCISCLQD